MASPVFSLGLSNMVPLWQSGKSTIIRNLAVPRHFVAYFVFISSIRVDPGPRNRGPMIYIHYYRHDELIKEIVFKNI
jgi:hypothetical protein